MAVVDRPRRALVSMGDGKRSPLVGVGFVVGLAGLAAVGLTYRLFGGVVSMLFVVVWLVVVRRGPLGRATGAFNEAALEERRRREDLLSLDQRRLLERVAGVPSGSRWVRNVLPASPRRVRDAAAELDVPVAEVRKQLAAIDDVLRRPRSTA